MPNNDFVHTLLAGGIAGTAVDTVLFPLDTIKTRLQSKQGFHAAGGFKGIYSGLSSAVIGSAPGAAAFFVTYESLKKLLRRTSSSTESEWRDPITHMIAASGGEIMACFVRVPTEVIKQRMQTGLHSSLFTAVSSIITTSGVSGLYRGYGITIFREIPFTCIQFPLYEFLKKSYKDFMGRTPSSVEAAAFGSFSGGVAAACTTPLDVVKTRIMLSAKGAVSGYDSIPGAFAKIVREEGVSALFKGIVPRVTWISIGGAVFLGTYEFALKLFRS